MSPVILSVTFWNHIWVQCWTWSNSSEIITK
jgi:hypothetical protein